jgi:RNA polymerase sigma-70 factor, ECF subfamily
MSSTSKLTARLLTEMRRCSQERVDELVPALYGELRRLAGSYRERGDHTLQPTSLVNEAYLRLREQSAMWQNRNHFFAIAAQTMRRVLVDQARRTKRGGRAAKVALERAVVYSAGHPGEMLALDALLGRLEQVDAAQAQVVERRVFGGLTERRAK